ncbi:iron ABC transporter permease [Kiritimatiellaeota bacterium B1221]|nr:iron ABC transporter permease [Kiritimatiellaeota bacterium B1221]
MSPHRGPGRFGVITAFLLLGTAAGYPLTVLCLQAVFPHLLSGGFGEIFQPFTEMIHTEGLGQLMGNSLAWAGATTLLAWMLGIPCGWFLARTRLPGKGLARLTLLAPVMTPPYVGALCYILIFQTRGFGDRILGIPEPIREAFFGFGGITLVMALSSFGYVALAAETAFCALPPRLGDAARQLGATRRTVAYRVVFPLLLPAILNAGILVFLDTLSNFGVPAVLGTRADLPLLPAEIFRLVTSWPLNLPLATALSSLLCLFALASVAATRRLTREANGKGERVFQIRRISLGLWGNVWAWLWFGLLFICSTGLPYTAMLCMSLIENWQESGPTWTFNHYNALFRAGSGGRDALTNSLRLSLGAATLCAGAGGYLAYVISRTRSHTRHLLDALGTLPRVLPKIILAVGLILAWNAPWIPLRIYGTPAMLLLAYISIYISDALNFGAASMSRMNQGLETAAESLGAGRLRVFIQVVLPHLAPALGAAWLMTFIVCMRELVASLLLLPPGMQTTATFVFNQFEQGDLAAAMAMATVTIGLTTVVLILFQSISFFRTKDS